MGTSEQVIEAATRLLSDQDRTWAWIARKVEVPYKRVLAEFKHCTRPLTLELALAVVDALGATLPELLSTDAPELQEAAA